MKDLGRVSGPRNLLFSLMARMDLVEQIGSGIKRIGEALKAYGLSPPVIEADGEWFSITFRRKPPHEALKKAMSTPLADTPSPSDRGEGVNEGVSEGLNRLLGYIRENPGHRTPHNSNTLNLPIKTLERWLKKLRDEGKVEFRGSPKTGDYWEI
jgi:ATP-dependent DNA helicase RecG